MLHPQCRCGAQKLLSDSPTPEEPTNLCQSNSVIDVATSTATLAQLPNCEDDEQESMKYRIDKASSGAASAELGMPAYEPCSPKMDYETQDELPDSPHSQHQQQQLQVLPPPTIALPPQPTHHQHHHHHDEEEQQQQLLQERIQHEFMLQQQHQHQHLQQQQQQHLALLQQQQQEAQQQQHSHQHQQLPQQQQQQQGVNMAITATGTNSIRRKQNPLFLVYFINMPFLLSYRTQGAHVEASEGALRAFSAAASVHQ